MTTIEMWAVHKRWRDRWLCLDWTLRMTQNEAQECRDYIEVVFDYDPEIVKLYTCRRVKVTIEELPPKLSQK